MTERIQIPNVETAVDEIADMANEGNEWKRSMSLMQDVVRKIIRRDREYVAKIVGELHD